MRIQPVSSATGPLRWSGGFAPGLSALTPTRLGRKEHLTSPSMGPAWLGVGVQRSGTTWLTDLLLQHPDMRLNQRGHKELHFFERFINEPFTTAHVAEYHDLFERLGGEWTPAYLRSLWIPELIQRAAPDALLIVSLRDPVERYFSSLRWHFRKQGCKPEAAWHRHGGIEAIWGGMYGTQLESWRRVVGERMLVLQYEAVVADPVPVIHDIWNRLGLDPVPVTGITKPSWTSTMPEERPLPEGLVELYRPQVDQIVDTWGLDPDLWPLGS